MGLYKTSKSDYQAEPRAKGATVSLPGHVYSNFDEKILDLGNITRVSTSRDAIAAVFDLARFTTFCGQIDPQLSVPEYMSVFLAWLFERIRAAATVRKRRDRMLLRTPLPFFAKFMGDGVLFLWDTAGLSSKQVVEIAIAMSEITHEYKRAMYPNAKYHFVDPPPALRVGVARGQVLSIGDGRDFVGPCINVAARLQKLSESVHFCLSARGFHVFSTEYAEELVAKTIPVRGVGARELVFVFGEDYLKLQKAEKSLFQEPHEEKRQPKRRTSRGRRPKLAKT